MVPTHVNIFHFKYMASYVNMKLHKTELCP